MEPIIAMPPVRTISAWRRPTWRGKTLGVLIRGYLMWLDEQLEIHGCEPYFVEDWEDRLLKMVREATGEIIPDWENAIKVEPANHLCKIHTICTIWMEYFRDLSRKLHVSPELKDEDYELYAILRYDFITLRAIKSQAIFLDGELRHQVWFSSEHAFGIETGVDW